jgi:serpin B
MRLGANMNDLIFRSIVCLVLAVLVTGCTGTPPGPRPVAPEKDKAEAVKGDNAFALDLYGKLRGANGNLFLSPASISTALAMTYAGARGDTAKEMARTLHFTLPQEKLHPAIGALLYDLNGPGKERGYQLSVANALWPQKGHAFLPEFIKINKDNYGAGLQEVDYGDTEKARQTINDWVQKHTQDKIKNLLKEGVLDADTRLVLTNAIYFKGDWKNPFEKERTNKGPFHLTSKQKVDVPFMRQTDHFNYLDGGNFAALEMPYAGQELSMVVFLPKKIDGLNEFEKSLSADNLTGWLGKLTDKKVDVIMPKFKITAEFSLKEALSSLGMPMAFSGKADFSGMDGKKDLYLSAVVHKAFVDVNEKGTEAAAATGVVATKLAARVDPIPIFRADHPFVFLIRDQKSGSILFLGRLARPAE